NVKRPFPRITYREAIELLKTKGMNVDFGDDFGGDEETVIANSFDRPVMISRYPTAIKAFYMQPDPQDPDVVLGMDMIAPEGYGEIIGGSQRIHEHDLLLQRIEQHGLPVEAFQWYLDVRKYGAFPHSGFGMGIERVVAWISGVPHLGGTLQAGLFLTPSGGLRGVPLETGDNTVYITVTDAAGCTNTTAYPIRVEP